MKKYILLVILITISLQVFAQDTEFWFAPPVRYTGTYQGHGGFVFSNPTNRQAVVNIYYYRDGSDTTIYIPAYSYNFMFYPSAADITAKLEVQTSVAGNPALSAAVHITSNIGITGYYIYDWSAQQETFMLKGAASAGTQFTMTTGYAKGANIIGGSGIYGSVNGVPYVGIAGTEDATNVNFTIPSACVGYAAGSHTVTLDKGCVLYLISNTGKIAGTTIHSDKPVTVTGGEICRNSNGAAGSGGACDHCADQIVSDAYAGNTYVMPLSGGFNVASDNYNRMNNYFELIALEPNTNVQIDWGNGLTPLVSLTNAGDIYISDTFRVNRPQSCATIVADKPIHIMQNTGHEATTCHLPNFYGTNTHQTSFYSYHEAAFNIYPAVSLVYFEPSKADYTISFPGQTETPLFDWITRNARWIDGEGDVPQFTGWKYIRFTLPDSAINQIITIKSMTAVFQLGFTSSFNYGTYINYLTAFNAEFSFDPDTIWTCPGIYTNLIGGIAQYYKWTFPDGSIHEGVSMNSVKAVQMGMYILEMTQGYNTVIDTCWVNNINFSKNGTIGKSLTKPFKIGKPQQFIPSIDEEAAKQMTEFIWTFQGGTPETSTDPAPTVVFNTTGVKKVTLYMKYETVYPDSTVAVCDSFLTVRIPVQPLSVDYYVNSSAPDKVGVNDQDKSDQELFNEGKSRDNPFNLEDALKQASQGDVIHIPEGIFTPKKGNSFVIDCDSITIQSGFLDWDDSSGDLPPSVENTIIQGNGGPAVIFELGPNVGACGISTATRLEGFTIRGGLAENGAGILFKGGASGTVANCIIRDNTATENGGGVYTAPYGGCGVSEDPIFYNVEMSGNHAKKGAGMYNNGSNPTLINVTISGNASSVAGAGMYNDNASPDIRNTIIHGNVTNGNPLKNEFTNDGGMPVISYSNISGCNGSGKEWNNTFGEDGGKNIDKSPLFRSTGYDTHSGLLKQGNYRLSFHSPSRNKGSNNYVWDLIFTDLDGNDRIQYDIVDMGPYEYVQAESPSVQHEVKIPAIDNVSTEPVMGNYYVEKQENFMVLFIPAKGYSLENMKITTGSVWQDERGGMEMIRHENGSVSVIFHQVTEPLHIQVAGVDPVWNEMIDNVTAVWASMGQIIVRTAKTTIIQIYDLSGALIKMQQVTAGESAINMPYGTYIVSLNNTSTHKVVIK